MWRSGRKKPRILIVTPEITYLPEGMGNMANALHAKAGGLADVSASLVAALFLQLLMTLIMQKEESLMDECATYCYRNIVSKLKMIDMER